jgi:hypothetical protein
MLGVFALVHDNLKSLLEQLCVGKLARKIISNPGTIFCNLIASALPVISLVFGYKLEMSPKMNVVLITLFIKLRSV